jgi:hypothetical protein
LKIHWLPENPRDHESIINKLRLEDKKLEFRDFVRIEIKPKDMQNFTRNLEDWILRIDEERTLPEWFVENRKKAEKASFQALEESLKIHVAIGEEKVKVDKGFLLASGKASIEAYDSVSIKASGSVSIEAYDSVSIEASGSVSIEAYDSVSIKASGSVSIEAYDSVSIEAYDSVSIEASGSVSIEAYDSVIIKAYDSTVKFTLKSKTATAIQNDKIIVSDLKNVIEAKKL